MVSDETEHDTETRVRAQARRLIDLGLKHGVIAEAMEMTPYRFSRWFNGDPSVASLTAKEADRFRRFLRNFVTQAEETQRVGGGPSSPEGATFRQSNGTTGHSGKHRKG
jgi:hypothetical protein